MRHKKKRGKYLWATSVLSTSLLCYSVSAQERPQATDAGERPLPPPSNGELRLVVQQEGVQPAPPSTSAGVEELPGGPPQAPRGSAAQMQSTAPSLDPRSGSGDLSQAQQATYTRLNDIVSGAEAATRSTTDVGDLLGKSVGALGVEVQRRNPIVSDTRVRGFQSSQVITTADGGYFFPTRPDLDTIVSRLDSSLVDNVVVIKGPYTVRRGPGFTFIDVATRSTPRYQNGFEGHGSTGITYKTNGEGWNGRQGVWGGGGDWGYRGGWDLLTANDYETGAHVRMPSGYNSQNFDFALGLDFTENLTAEFKYFRQQQRNVEFPGALIDVNRLVCDALDMRIVLKEGDAFLSALDAWFNETRFDGDNLRPSKRAQIPQVDDLGAGLFNRNVNPPIPLTGTGLTLNLVTNGDNNSWGFRHATTFGPDQGLQVSGGWDFRYLSQAINEFDTFYFRNAPGEVTFNFPLPRSHQLDPGLFLDTNLPLVDDKLTVKAGTRVDFVSSTMQRPTTAPQPAPPFNPGPGQTPVSNAVNETTIAADLGGPGAFATKHFNLWSGFGTAEYKLSQEVILLAGYGVGERPPSLVELYGAGPFLSLLQNGGTFVFGRGDPQLHPEHLTQVDLGIKAAYEKFRAGATGFYSQVHNYITYDPVLDQAVPNFLGFRFKNTPLARLTGCEAYGEYDLGQHLTPFATLSYVNGRDQSKGEPLPGIYPLDSRVGLRLHDAGKQSRWGIEFAARLVASQHLVAASLGEAPTPSFAVYDIRSYWMVRQNFLLTAGVENIGNLNYQEAFDLRRTATGGVFQPGFNFYMGMRMSY